MFDHFFIALTDVIDILFVAVLLYTAIVWAQKTQAAFVVRGILILAVIYLVARQLDLQLTAWFFQGFFAIFLIIIVVIFQEELRQIFERIAVWSLHSQRPPALHSEAVNILVRTLSDLAKDRIGALIVLKGNDPVDRHIMGGIELNGKISEPLLKSIFDPHSPGHDGAVVIDQDQIDRFAAHLPLSKNFQQLPRAGTRHSAALGLAELTDALSIVVSEERGTLSVAREGRLWEVGNFQELGAILQQFLEEKYPTKEHKKFSIELFRKNWVAKTASLSLAVAFWYVFVPGSKIIEVTYRVPIQLQNLPGPLQLEGVQPSEVTLLFTGQRRDLYLFDPGTLKVTVDVSLAEFGRRTFTISEQNVRYPKDLTLKELAPSVVRISVKKPARGTEDSKG